MQRYSLQTNYFHALICRCDAPFIYFIYVFYKDFATLWLFEMVQRTKIFVVRI